MQLQPIHTLDIQKALDAIQELITQRESEINDMIDSQAGLKFLHSAYHRKQKYISDDIQITILRKEQTRILSLSIPIAYHWEK